MKSDQPSSKPDLYVVARIVKALRDGGPTRRTQLALTTGLSYDSLVRYLGWMGERGFVVLDADDKVVLTPEGVEAYDLLVRWILEHVGKLKFPRF